jgi:hypothetical protein
MVLPTYTCKDTEHWHNQNTLDSTKQREAGYALAQPLCAGACAQAEHTHGDVICGPHGHCSADQLIRNLAARRISSTLHAKHACTAANIASATLDDGVGSMLTRTAEPVSCCCMWSQQVQLVRLNPPAGSVAAAHCPGHHLPPVTPRQTGRQRRRSTRSPHLGKPRAKQGPALIKAQQHRMRLAVDTHVRS